VEDLPFLAQHIIERGRIKFGMPRLRISKRAEKLLLNYGWPGNVRELENKLNRAAITCKGSVIEPEDLLLSETSFKSLDYRDARQMFDRNFILNALKMANGNVSQAAKASGLTRPTLYDMMKKAGVSMQIEARLDDV
jgi:two-component system NtrC family response regulator